MDTTFKVLELLCHADGAVSGEEIGTRLGLSRSAVCKHIGKLRGVGFSIESTTNVGHRLRFDRDLYNAYTLALALKAEGMEMPVSFLETVDSTNLEAKRAGYEQAEGLVAARRQTGGRGRKSRGFSSEAGGLYFSYYCRPAHLLPYDAVKAVLTAGLSVAEALRECGADAGIKWPNDVLIGAPVDLITQKYAEFLRYIRGKYPQAAIFVCYGAMTTSLNGALSSMVNSLGDDNVYACALPALATGGHPREQQHQTNGFQLGAIIIRTLGLAGESFQ